MTPAALFILQHSTPPPPPASTDLFAYFSFAFRKQIEGLALPYRVVVTVPLELAIEDVDVVKFVRLSGHYWRC